MQEVTPETETPEMETADMTMLEIPETITPEMEMLEQAMEMLLKEEDFLIHHHQIMRTPMEEECLDNKEGLKNWNLQNQLKFRNLSDSKENQCNFSIPGGFLSMCSYKINPRSFSRMRGPFIGSVL